MREQPKPTISTIAWLLTVSHACLALDFLSPSQIIVYLIHGLKIPMPQIYPHGRLPVEFVK
jgi:hypothetical protein